MEQKNFGFNKKKRVVIKIGSSSLTHPETGNLDFIKMMDSINTIKLNKEKYNTQRFINHTMGGITYS